MCIRILIADDHELVRDAFKRLIESEPGYQVVGQARTGHEAVRLASQFSPDIILMDIYMPSLNGIEATARLCASCCKSKIIGVSSCGDQRTISRLLAAGAHAYVSKSWPPRELFRAINTIHANQHYRAATSLIVPKICGQPPIANAGKLSLREQETLALIAAGKSSQAIADELCVCLKTVEAHRHNLRQKLGRSSVADLTRYAIEEGLGGAQI